MKENLLKIFLEEGLSTLFLRNFRLNMRKNGQIHTNPHEATFYDNENGFVAVAEYKNGEILQNGNHKPQWLAELMEYMDR